MCKYCISDTKMEDTKSIIDKSFPFFSEEISIDLCIQKNNLELLEMTSNGDAFLELSTKINYCPMCGRKLSEDETDGES